ncbi:tetratricopeptide repeat protein [bacterium]|nr:tetratricopeptide repeat protein [bacterium]
MNRAPQAIWQQAIAAHQAGRLSEAEAEYQKWLSFVPQDGAALHQLALVFAQQGRTAEALQLFRRAAPLCPQRADVWANLGEAERRAGNLPAAIECLQRALKLAPQFPEAVFNLGCALRDARQIEAAINAFRRAVELRPNYARAHHNLGNLMRGEGKLPVAVTHYQQAIACQPQWWEPQWNLAVTQLELGESEQALARLQQLKPLIPPTAEIEPDTLLGDIYARRGQIELARQHYQRVLELHPERSLSRLRNEMLGPVISADEDAIQKQRQEAIRLLQSDRNSAMSWEIADLSGSSAEPPMIWTYHGENERPLKAAYADLFLNRIAPVTITPRVPRTRPHVGWLVTTGHEGVFNRCLGGLVEQLVQRGQLQVSWVSTRAGLNVLQHLRPSFAGGRFEISDKVAEAAQQLAASDIDILCYWEVGTDSMNYFLPFFRAVPYQLATWGWPSTAGHDRMDGFLSSALLEPEDGADHYVERLISLPVLPTWYERPEAPAESATRARWGIAADQHLLVCAQNLRKLLPVFDRMLRTLLEQDAAAVVLLLADEQPTITEMYRQRLSQTVGPFMDRVQFVSRMPRDVYLGLIRAADVVLDSIGYGGGANTALDAASVGTPVVTLTGRYHRGRWQTAVNRLLDVPELNVDTTDDYARQVLRLCTDRLFREEMQTRILGLAGNLFESAAAVAAYEHCFLRVAGGELTDLP